MLKCGFDDIEICNQMKITPSLLTRLKTKSAFSDITDNSVVFNKSQTLKEIEQIAISTALLNEKIKQQYTKSLFVKSDRMDLENLQDHMKTLNEITRSSNVDIKSQINKQNDISTATTIDFSNVKLVFSDDAFTNSEFKGEEGDSDD
jgi:hypothetical protein